MYTTRTVRTSYSRAQFVATVNFIVQNNPNGFSKERVECELSNIIRHIHSYLSNGEEIYSSGTMGFMVNVVDTEETDSEIRHYLDILVDPNLSNRAADNDMIELVRHNS